MKIFQNPIHVWNFNLCWVRFLHAQFKSCPWAGSEGPQIQIFIPNASCYTYLHMLSRSIILRQLCLDKRSLGGLLQAVEMTALGDAARRVVLQEALVAASRSQTKSTKLTRTAKLNSEVVWCCLMDSFCCFSDLCHMFERPTTWTWCSSPSGAVLHWRSCGIPQRYAPAVVAWDCVRASVCFLFLRPLSVSISR